MRYKTVTDLDNQPRAMTPHDVGLVLGKCDKTILSWLKAGKLKGTKLGRGWIIDREYVRKIIAGEISLDSQEVAR